MKPMTFGVIVGNRGFFPDRLAEEGRAAILAVLRANGHRAVCLTPRETRFGTVETYADAQKCGQLFKKHAGAIDGVIVTLPNFGDEKGVANSLRCAGLDVPVLVQATPDDPRRMKMGSRRDSFCGKISVCNNLKQYGIRYSLTARHTEAVDAEAFAGDLETFAAVCRVVKGLRHARIGAIGVRPAAFNTVRSSEKLLEASGIAVETIDLSEITGRCDRLKDSDTRLKQKLAGLQGYVPCAGIPKAALQKMARLALVIEEWMQANDLACSAIQCWTALEEFYGVVPCTVMSMLSNKLMPAACEVDVCGALSMYALTLAAQGPSALVDWNNNYGDDPDTCVLFHCSNLPKKMFAKARMDYQQIIAGSVGKANTYGTCVGRVKSGPFTFARITTDDATGEICAYTGEGELLPDPLTTFGGYGVARINKLQALLEHVWRAGFEHHVAINYSCCADAIAEAFGNYLDWDVYWHQD